jgi:hypothetical protein
VGIGKANESEPPMKCRNNQMTSKPETPRTSGMSLAGAPFIGQAVSGMKAARARSAASAWNVGRREVDTVGLVQEWAGWARGSASSGRIREALSTVAIPAGGPVRSSGEASVMGVERRGRLIVCTVRASNREGLRVLHTGGDG